MFSKDITGSDAFLEMPASSQALYFHLGMEADDDGFIGNPKKVMRVMGVSDDDFKILLAKRFLLAFNSGIVVVKHHRINNNWDKHNCKRTIYLEEFSQLRIKENRAYTLDETQGVPLQSDSRLNPVFRIEENRIDKAGALEDELRVEKESNSESPSRFKPAKYPHALEVFTWFPNPQPSWKAQKSVAEREYAEYLYKRGEEAVRGILAFCVQYGDMEFFPAWQCPSKLEKNWVAIQAFANRNGL